MSSYYNEIDPFAAQWLRNLISAGHIAPGEVDERSIVDVRADDLRGFRQCHFFAGIGVWSHALRQAGFPDEREVWTGSCPCQPFSAAGAGKGFSDERDLWPAFFALIRECRPVVAFGEQVASKDGLAWLDLVCEDLEGEGYAVGAVDTCAAGYGAPHIRQRLYWVADAELRTTERYEYEVGGAARGMQGVAREQRFRTDAGNGVATRGLAHPTSSRADGGQRKQSGSRNARGLEPSRSGIVGDADCSGLQGRTATDVQGAWGRNEGRATGCTSGAPGYANGFWRNAEWLPCRDGKARPVEPGTFPLVDGTPGRVGRLRCYGNAIVGPQAQAFIEAYLT